MNNTNKEFVTPSPPRWNQLSILNKVLEAYKFWQNFLPSLPRISRYTIASKIDYSFLELLELILIAGYSKKTSKVKILEKASRKLDILKFLFRIGWEIKAIDNKKYICISKSLAEIGKMFGGWQKINKNTPPKMEE